MGIVQKLGRRLWQFKFLQKGFPVPLGIQNPVQIYMELTRWLHEQDSAARNVLIFQRPECRIELLEHWPLGDVVDGAIDGIAVGLAVT